MIKYEFKDKPITLKRPKGVKPNAQKIGEALSIIKDQTKGQCTSQTVLDAVKGKPKNYLHRFFDWKDDVAAEKWRKVQARELMNCINIVDLSQGRERKLPAFVSIVDRAGHSYHRVDQIMNSTHLTDLALRQAEADMESYERRLMQFADVCDAIRKARELIAERRARYTAAGGHQPHA
jgi:hypothetical protein